MILIKRYSIKDIHFYDIKLWDWFEGVTWLDEFLVEFFASNFFNDFLLLFIKTSFIINAIVIFLFLYDCWIFIHKSISNFHVNLPIHVLKRNQTSNIELKFQFVFQSRIVFQHSQTIWRSPFVDLSLLLRRKYPLRLESCFSKGLLQKNYQTSQCLHGFLYYFNPNCHLLHRFSLLWTSSSASQASMSLK